MSKIAITFHSIYQNPDDLNYQLTRSKKKHRKDKYHLQQDNFIEHRTGNRTVGS